MSNFIAIGNSEPTPDNLPDEIKKIINDGKREAGFNPDGTPIMSKPYSQPGEKGTDTNQDELFSLCKRVYDMFPFWAGTDMIYGKEQDGDWKIMPLTLSIPKRNRIPLYTSDYLLEKLPPTIKNEFDGDDDYLILYRKSGTWYADYMGQFLRCKGDTPLKALLKLAIALSEAGELNG